MPDFEEEAVTSGPVPEVAAPFPGAAEAPPPDLPVEPPPRVVDYTTGEPTGAGVVKAPYPNP